MTNMILLDPFKCDRPILPKKPGWYPDELGSSSATNSSSAVGSNSISYFPFVIREFSRVLELGFSVFTAGVAGMNFKVNLYNADSDYFPSQKLLTDLVIPVDSSGNKIIPVDLNLRGLNFLAMARSGGSAASVIIRQNTVDSTRVFAINNSSFSTSPSLATRYTGFTFANTMPAIALQNTPITYVTGSVPYIWYRI